MVLSTALPLVAVGMIMIAVVVVVVVILAEGVVVVFVVLMVVGGDGYGGGVGGCGVCDLDYGEHCARGGGLVHGVSSF